MSSQECTHQLYTRTKWHSLYSPTYFLKHVKDNVHLWGTNDASAASPIESPQTNAYYSIWYHNPIFIIDTRCCLALEQAMFPWQVLRVRVRVRVISDGVGHWGTILVLPWMRGWYCAIFVCVVEILLSAPTNDNVLWWFRLDSNVSCLKGKPLLLSE